VRSIRRRSEKAPRRALATSIAYLRATAGLSREAFAEAIGDGASRQLVFAWETGKHRPPLHRIPAIAKALRLSPATAKVLRNVAARAWGER